MGLPINWPPVENHVLFYHSLSLKIKKYPQARTALWGGDQLTNARVNGAKRSKLNEPESNVHFVHTGYGPWHTKLNAYKVSSIKERKNHQ